MFFRVFVPGLINYHFRDFILEQTTEIKQDRPLLILANHFSWWDGFTHFYLNMYYLGKQFHVMMLEEELEKRLFLRNVGAFSINRGRKDIMESLQYAGNLLNDPQNMVLLFPTGRLQTLYAHSFPFQRGLERILENASSQLQVIFSFVLPEYGPYPKPALHVYLKNYIDWQADLQRMEKAFNDYFREVVDQQYQRIF